MPFINGTDWIEQLESCASVFNHRIIMGDFNANLLSSSADEKFMRNLESDLSLKIVEHGATHHTDVSHTWIDAIMDDDNDEILTAGNRIAIFSSRHTIIDVTIRVHTEQTSIPSAFTCRDFKSVESSQLISILENCDWSLLDRPEVDVSEELECLSSNLLKTVDILASLKNFTPKNKLPPPPRVDPDLLNLYCKRTQMP